MSRWTLQTLDGADSYTFAINPDHQDAPQNKDLINWSWNFQSGFAGIRAPKQPVLWHFSGVLRSQAQYDELIAWATTHRTKVRLTTDLPETLIIRITGFAPERTAPQRVAAPWRHTYSITALIFSSQPGVSNTVTAPTSTPALTLHAPAGSTGNATVLGTAVLSTVEAPDGAVSAP